MLGTLVPDQREEAVFLAMMLQALPVASEPFIPTPDRALADKIREKICLKVACPPALKGWHGYFWWHVSLHRSRITFDISRVDFLLRRETAAGAYAESLLPGPVASPPDDPTVSVGGYFYVRSGNAIVGFSSLAHREGMRSSR